MVGMRKRCPFLIGGEVQNPTLDLFWQWLGNRVLKQFV